jgi:hypothetical protein
MPLYPRLSALLLILAVLVMVILMPSQFIVFPNENIIIVQPTMTVYADDDDLAEHHEERNDEEEGPYEEAFKWIGKLAVVLGALSLSWYLMKRKRVSKNMQVRKVANVFYRLHTYTGWGALVLVIAHGVYFVVYNWLEDDTITGLLAFILLTALGIYGVLLSRRRVPRYRRIHFGLALLWLILTVVHADDAIPLLVIVVGSSYGLIFWLERRQLAS